MARQKFVIQEEESSTSVLALTNLSEGRSNTLLSFIASAARTTVGKGTRRRHLYILTCYFDPPALREITVNIVDGLTEGGGAVAGITVAVDVGEWIRCWVSREELARDLAAASHVDLKLVRIVPIQFPCRLLHAKAYAAISPEGAASKGFVVVTSGNATRRGLGLDNNNNVELAVLVTQQSALFDFEKLMRELVNKSVSTRKAMQQDRFLLALALFSSGTFYHKWQGSLSSEIRFKFDSHRRGKGSQAQGRDGI